MISQVLDHPPVKQTDMWLHDWLGRRTTDADLADSTQQHYRYVIDAVLIPMLGDRTVEEITAADIVAAKALWLTTRAPGTVRNYLVILRAALDDAVVDGLLLANPMASIKAPNSRRVARIRRALSEEEIGRLLASAAYTRVDVLIRVALATGARQSELLAAEWADIDDRGWHIARRLRRLPGRGLVVSRPKSARSLRLVELSPATRGVLFNHHNPTPLVFPAAGGGYWDAKLVHGSFSVVRKRARLEDIDFHCLRHTAASMWIKAGADVFTVSRRLGHASAAFTMDVYGHLLLGQQSVAAAALDELIA